MSNSVGDIRTEVGGWIGKTLRKQNQQDLVMDGKGAVKDRLGVKIMGSV